MRWYFEVSLDTVSLSTLPRAVKEVPHNYLV